MRIIQIVLNYFSGDGVGNCLTSLKMLLDRMGIDNVIWAKQISDDINDSRVYTMQDNCFEMLTEEDIIIYHFSIGCELNRIIAKTKCRKILVYQNVTPSHFFKNIDAQCYLDCLKGEEDARNTVGNYLKCITPSEYSRRELIAKGWNPEDVIVIPIYESKDIQTKSNMNIINKYRHSMNFLYAGRLAPNKRIEDILAVFDYYQKNYDENAWLFLVGGNPYSVYNERIVDIISKLKIKNVEITGKVTQEDLEAYYEVADIYISMSEHEGFCLPILEAMSRRVVVVAYNSTAVGDTMQNAGILVSEKNAESICAKINEIANKYNRDEIIRNQLTHVGNYNIYKFEKVIEKLITDVKEHSIGTEIKKIEFTIPDYKNKMSFLKNRMKMTKSTKVVIYGMGKMGKLCYKEIGEIEKDNELIIIDNAMVGVDFDGHVILSSSEGIDKHKDAVFIVTVQKSLNEIVDELIEHNINCYRIILFYPQAMM